MRSAPATAHMQCMPGLSALDFWSTGASCYGSCFSLSTSAFALAVTLLLLDCRDAVALRPPPAQRGATRRGRVYYATQVRCCSLQYACSAIIQGSASSLTGFSQQLDWLLAGNPAGLSHSLEAIAIC